MLNMSFIFITSTKSLAAWERCSLMLIDTRLVLDCSFCILTLISQKILKLIKQLVSCWCSAKDWSHFSATWYLLAVDPDLLVEQGRRNIHFLIKGHNQGLLRLLVIIFRYLSILHSSFDSKLQRYFSFYLYFDFSKRDLISPHHVWLTHTLFCCLSKNACLTVFTWRQQLNLAFSAKV